MKITEHGDYLIQLSRLGSFNCYFLREDDGLTLVDTNLSGSAKGIIQAAESLGLPIKRLTLTHAHADHAASMDAVIEALPEVEVTFSARTERFLAGDLSLEADEPQSKLRGSYVTSNTKPSRRLAPGDQIGSLKVFAAPGHTPDQIAFIDVRDETLIAGDAYQTKAGTAVMGVMRWLFPFPAMATWDKPTALATARNLYDLQPRRLAVGHGRVLEDPLAEMEKAISEAERSFGGQTQVA
jgi:glyoxylase-like metal-dependent hydrolase (beta-lactamase superfamily II)